MAADEQVEGAAEGDVADNELARQLATLALSQVEPAGPLEAAAAAAWWNLLARLGVRLPLVVVHDLGLLLTRSRQGVGAAAPRAVRRAGVGGAPSPLLERYQALLASLSASEALEELATTPL